MKENLIAFFKTNLRHLTTGASAYLVDQGLVEPADSDSLARIVAGILSIIITRLLLILLAKINWLDAFKKIFNRLTQSSNLLVLGAMSAAAGFGFFLPSCSLPVSGNVFYQHEGSGAKGGLEVDKGGIWRPWAKVLIKDDDGETVGTVGGALEVAPEK